MVFGTRKMLPKLQDITLSLLGKNLLPSKTAKDLGVLLHPHLSYNSHIIKTVSSCMSALGQIIKPCQKCIRQKDPSHGYEYLSFKQIVLLFKRVGQLLEVKFRQITIGTKLCVYNSKWNSEI